MGSSKKPSSTIVNVDPATQRPRNADESAPETLVPDVVRTHLQKESREAPSPKRWRRIQQRAHEIAQQRGFTPGHELEDWLQAEAEIDADQPQPPEAQFTG